MKKVITILVLLAMVACSIIFTIEAFLSSDRSSEFAMCALLAVFCVGLIGYECIDEFNLWLNVFLVNIVTKTHRAMPVSEADDSLVQGLWGMFPGTTGNYASAMRMLGTSTVIKWKI